MKSTRLRGSLFLVLFSLMLGSWLGVAGTANGNQSSDAQYNVYKDIMDHKGGIEWKATGQPPLPSGVCLLFTACTGDKAPPKVFVLPPATINGRKVGMAVFLTQIKDAQHPALILEHQTRSDVYFFMLSPDGSIQKAVYLEQGKPFLLIANELAEPVYKGDKKNWHDWASKLGSKPAAPHPAAAN